MPSARCLVLGNHAAPSIHGCLFKQSRDKAYRTRDQDGWTYSAGQHRGQISLGGRQTSECSLSGGSLSARYDEPANLTRGSQFLVKGVVYQDHRRSGSSRSDPLADDGIEALRRDLEAFRELGLNTLFVCKCRLGWKHGYISRK